MTQKQYEFWAHIWSLSTIELQFNKHEEITFLSIVFSEVWVKDHLRGELLVKEAVGEYSLVYHIIKK